MQSFRGVKLWAYELDILEENPNIPAAKKWKIELEQMRTSKLVMRDS